MELTSFDTNIPVADLIGKNTAQMEALFDRALMDQLRSQYLAFTGEYPTQDLHRFWREVSIYVTAFRGFLDVHGANFFANVRVMVGEISTQQFSPVISTSDLVWTVCFTPKRKLIRTWFSLEFAGGNNEQ